MEKEIKKNIEKNIQKHDTLPVEGSFDFQTRDGGIYKCSYTVKKTGEVEPMDDFSWFLDTLY